MQQKSKFIIVITLICFISLLFLPVKVWSVNENISGGGGGSCTKVCKEMAYKTVDYGYGPFDLYYCKKYYPLPSYCYNGGTTATTKEKKKYYYNTCNRSGWPWNYTWRCVRAPHYNDGDDQCQVDADCGNGGTTTPTSPKYSCDTSTWTCSSDSNGAYSSLSTCQSNCVNPSTWSPPPVSPPPVSPPPVSPPPVSPPPVSPPPVSPPPVSPPPAPKCQIFEFSINGKTNEDRDPLFVWVNAVLKGYISVNDSCTKCTVTSDDTWGNPPKDYTITSISTDINESFKIPESGTYSFTVECIGDPADPDDFDEDTVSLKTVQAINLPWWREIIPVLPGFLRGIWR